MRETDFPDPGAGANKSMAWRRCAGMLIEGFAGLVFQGDKQDLSEMVRNRLVSLAEQIGVHADDRLIKESRALIWGEMGALVARERAKGTFTHGTASLFQDAFGMGQQRFGSAVEIARGRWLKAGWDAQEAGHWVFAPEPQTEEESKNVVDLMGVMAGWFHGEFGHLMDKAQADAEAQMLGFGMKPSAGAGLKAKPL